MLPCDYRTVSIPLLLPPFAVAFTCTVVAVVTGFVTTVTVPVTLPAGIVMLAGKELRADAPLWIVKETTVSLARGCAKVTVPTVVDPPTTEFGEKVNAVGTLGVTVSDAALETPFAAAET